VVKAADELEIKFKATDWLDVAYEIADKIEVDGKVADDFTGPVQASLVKSKFELVCTVSSELKLASNSESCVAGASDS
jgi:hypothetical protein